MVITLTTHYFLPSHLQGMYHIFPFQTATPMQRGHWPSNEDKEKFAADNIKTSVTIQKQPKPRYYTQYINNIF
jgi:hypothetical protein